MSNSDKGIYEFYGFRLEGRERQFSYEGTSIRLSEKAFETLLAFVTRPGRLLSKEELMEAVWPNSFVEENNLDKNVSILRKTFNQFGPDEIYIETVRGHGYRFLPNVTELVEGADAAVAGSPQPKNEEPMTLPSAAIAAVVLIVLAGIAGKLIFSGDAPSSGPTAETQKIAILPLRPLTTSDRNEAIELGVTEALIDRLNAGEALRALPLSSVRRFANEDQDAVSAGRELGADSVLEGTVQTTAGRIRISVRLYRVADGNKCGQRCLMRVLPTSLQFKIGSRHASPRR
jgi:DNA-binding winged helix-turn-helix (wHTH) protein/TolB-like protein